MNGSVGATLFAVKAQRLLREGEVEEALRLGREGVATHPDYATGRLILGLTCLAAGELEEARSELETARDLDGPAPALLQALTLCYDGLGQTDLAAECRMLGEGFGRNPLMDEPEGGPEMVEERDDSLDPGDEELESGEGPRAMFEIGNDAGSPEEALKELEELLSGAGSSLEGEAIGEEASIGDDPSTVEEPVSIGDDLPAIEEPAEAGSTAPDEATSEEEDKSELWAQILEQADGVEEPGSPPAAEARTIDLDANLDVVTPAVEEVGAIDLDADLDLGPPAVEEAGAIDLDADLDLDPPAVEEVGAIDLDADLDLDPPAVEEVGAIDLDADLDTETPEVEEAGAIDLDLDLDIETSIVEEAATIDLDAPLDLEGVAAFDTEVEPIEGLEVSTPGGEADIGMVEGTDDVDLETGPEDGDVGSEEDLLPGPLELPDEVFDAVSEGLELDDPLEATLTGNEDVAGITDDETSGGILDMPDTEPDDLEDVLKSLEAELETGSVADDGAGLPMEDGPVPTDEEPVEISLDDENIPLDMDQALDDLGESEDVKPVAEEHEKSGAESDGEQTVDWVVGASGGSTQIEDNDDSIQIAIRAEILVGKGEYKEAVKLFEALQLWDPDRESYRIRLEEVRRMTKQSE